jgi:uncharacterized protein YciI
MFFITGKSSAGIEKSDLEKMQSAHLANLTRLYNEGKALIAGPLADPEKRLRGIVLLKLKDREDVRSCFRTDPYIQSGLMKIEAHPVMFDTGGIGRAKEPMQLGRYALVLVFKGERWREEKQHPTPGGTLSGAAEPAAKVSAFTTAGGDLLALHLYAVENLEDVRSAIAADRRVSQGVLKVRTLQQYLAKGVIEG